MPTLHLPAQLDMTVTGPVEQEYSRRRTGRGTFFVLGIAAALLYLHVAAEPRITLSARSLRFAPTTKGTASDSMSFLVTNSGVEALHVGSLELQDEAAGDFAVTTDCNGATLAPQRSCLVSVAMTPSETGERLAEVVIPNDSDEKSPAVRLAGEGRAPALPDITPTPAVLHFEQPVNVSSTMPVVLSNTGTVTVNIGEVTLKAPAQFSRGSGCEQKTLPVKGTCSFDVTYLPTQDGQSTGEVGIDYASGRTLTVPIAATALVPVSTTPAPAPTPSQPEGEGHSSVEPRVLEYRLEPGKPSAPKTVFIKNVGDGPVHVTGATITKAANDFSVRNSCESDIAPSKSCTLEVDFTGDARSRSEGTLVVSASDGTFPVTLIAEPVQIAAAIAEVTPIRLALSPAGREAGSGLVALFLGQRDVVSVHNAGNAPLEFARFSFEPEGEFSVSATGLKSPCGKGAVSPSATCQLRVVYQPKDGSGRATFLIFDNAGNSPQRVMLYGQVPRPARGQLQVDAYDRDFGSATVGMYSVAGVRMARTPVSHRILLRNVGTGDLNISSLQQPSDKSYTAQSDCPHPLAPSHTCVLVVTFRPISVGPHPTSLVIDNDGSSGAVTLSFEGQGINPYSKTIPSSRIRLSSTPVASTPVPK